MNGSHASESDAGCHSVARLSRCALIATITALAIISTASHAGVSKVPCWHAHLLRGESPASTRHELSYRGHCRGSPHKMEVSALGPSA